MKSKLLTGNKLIPIAKPYMTSEEAQAAYDTILTGWITQGPRVQEFEERFADITEAKYAVAVSNCTTALHLAMIVSGVGPGDEVICPSMSYIATANAIAYTGATPIFAEVDPYTYNIDILDVEKRITPRTKAVLIVHQIGMPADIDSFSTLCKKYKLKLIEDAACAIGSAYKGKKIGCHSELVCFSFHPRKVISTGDGGMITTNNKEYYERLQLLRQHGMSINDRVRHESSSIIFEDHLEIGYNYRLTDIQASVGIKQLEKLKWLIEERRKIAFLYHDLLKDIDCIRLPVEQDGYFSNYQSYNIYLKPGCPITRNDLMAQLLNDGISTRRGVMTTHTSKAYRHLYPGLELPVSENLQERSIIIPLYVPMSENDVRFVAQSFKNLVS